MLYAKESNYGRFSVRGIPAILLTRKNGEVLHRYQGLVGQFRAGTLVDSIVETALRYK